MEQGQENTRSELTINDLRALGTEQNLSYFVACGLGELKVFAQVVHERVALHAWPLRPEAFAFEIGRIGRSCLEEGRLKRLYRARLGQDAAPSCPDYRHTGIKSGI